MKNKLLKIIAVVMSIMMLFSVFSVYSSAFSSTITEHKARNLDGYSVYNLLINQRNTIAFVEAVDEDYENFKYFYTVNGFSYWEIDFNSYAPKCDFVELAASRCEGDTFLFLFYCYDVEYVYDNDFKEYFEEYEVKDGFFLITKDFKSFEKHSANVKSDTSICSGDYYEFTNSGVLEYLDGEWVFANGDYIVTGKKGDKKLGKGVYYTTKDFKNWKPHYTHEKVVWDVAECGFSYFTNYGGLFVFENFDDSKVYLLLNDKCYGPFVHDYGEDVSVMVDYVYMQGSERVLRFDTILTDEYMDDETGEIYPDFRLVLIDITNGNEKELYKSECDFYYEVLDFNDRMYLSVTNWETGKTTVYEIHHDYIINKVDTSLDLFDCIYAYQAGSALYECSYDEVNVYKGNLRDGYSVDLDDANYKIVNNERVTFEFNEYMCAFGIGGSFVILETNPRAGRSVAYEFDNTAVRTKGDTNFDGIINSSDALKILQVATGLVTVNTYEKHLFDIDGNGAVQSSDALRVLQYATRLVGSIKK